MDPTPFDEALIVDTRPVAPREASRQIVSALGARRTLLADSVRQAQQVVRERQPGLVVIELDALGQAGITLIRRLAKSHPAVRLLVLSESDATMRPCRRCAPVPMASCRGGAASPKWSMRRAA